MISFVRRGRAAGYRWAWFDTSALSLSTQTPQRRVLATFSVCDMKMDPKWIGTLLILAFCHNVAPEAGEVHLLNEGENHDINCIPSQKGTVNFWFRSLDDAGLEFIVSSTHDGQLKVASKSASITLASANKIKLKSFQRAKDSGLYSCASLYQNQLFFGLATRLAGVKMPEITTKATTTTTANVSTTTKACVCEATKKHKEISPALMCDPLILGPLAASCGLLLLLLIITILYCNRVRTRRCPHHYRRKPGKAPVKQMEMLQRHV
ncbi:T-cell surface glycoprotein CD8 alpha chain [Genypterus blacodes]|uniref:T-cell surface glycoprotein CD8 alpha chain n=1 Tax=Genypterus blacodes TaxID=154954 RepID=UPI003F7729B2